MANWSKQYDAASAKGDIMRGLGFSAMKSNNLDDRDVIDNLEKMVDAQIQLERKNASIQRDKGYCIGLFFGAAATYTGLLIGIISKTYRNKK